MVDFDSMLQGQVDFRRQFSGRLWLEVMLVKGVNDTEHELREIRHAIDLIEPDRVYILTPIRPPAEPWVQPSPPQSILTAQEILGTAVPLPTLESGQFGLHESEGAEQTIIEIGSRHPLRRDQANEIEKALGVPGTVAKMLEAGELILVQHNGEKYLLPTHFVRGRETA
jgi:wyosine [tRNA(Phe)-imidazoG37] synthetase (radical SAM superfamily)